MSSIQDQIENLRKKIQSYQALRDDLGNIAEQKIAGLEEELAALMQSQQALIAHSVVIEGDVTGSTIIIGDGNAVTKLTGALTFFFTDIEGSTQLWEEHPKEMKQALARHDVVLRQAIKTHHGHIFKTVGDAFYATFTNASDALAAALEAQQGICAEHWGETPIRVRMGLHTGEVEARDGDYFGPPLNRVARLMSAGYGGQVLLSTATAELIRPNLPLHTDLRDMGERRLKDLTRPEHIFQLTAPGLPADFPPLKTIETVRTNLPPQLTSFIGREKEIAAVKGLIAQHRLTSLTGSGGAGKTRLSLQVAADLLDAYPGGVWFIELAPISDPDLIAQIVVGTLGLREDAHRSLLTVLTDYLRPKTTLLVIDNCEHLIEAAAEFAETLLQNCPNLRLLVSSREALGISGEMAYRVPSLSAPKANTVQPVAELATLESVQLFVERAQVVRKDFTLSQQNAPAIAQICTRLDGIPLAIELAAARVKMLRVEQIAERLGDRFRLLTGGSRTALPRQQTLRAMIDWSYDLLPESERVLLRRLSVFAGGWTLEAAETVCQGSGIPDYDVLGPLTRLVDKSLVVVGEGVETRYHLLETVRQYAREKLTESGEGMMVRDLHLQYFLGLAERADSEFVGPNEPEWEKRLEEDLDNIRAAIEWSLKGDAQVGLRLASALWLFSGSSGRFHAFTPEKIAWLTQLLEQPANAHRNAARAKALLVLGALHVSELETGLAYTEQSLSIYQEINDQHGIAFALQWVGFFIALQENTCAALSLYRASLALFRKLGHKFGMARTLRLIGELVGANDYAKTYIYFEESLKWYRELGTATGIASALECLGMTALLAKDYTQARTLFLETQKTNFSAGISEMSGGIANGLARLALEEGNYEEARVYLEEMIAFTQEYGLPPNPFLSMDLGYIALWQGDLISARSIFTKTLVDDNFTVLKITGKAWAIEGLASLFVLQNKPERAAQLFSCADAMYESVSTKQRTPIAQEHIDHNLAMIRAQLDEATVIAAQAAGRAMSIDEAIALALKDDDPLK